MRADRLLPPDTEVIAGTVPKNGTLAELFRAYLPEDRAAHAVDVVAASMDPRKLRADRPFTLTRSLDGFLRAFHYEVDPDHYLRVEPASPSTPDELAASVVAYAREEATAVTTGHIDKETPSLFEAMEEAGETADLSVELELNEWNGAVEPRVVLCSLYDSPPVEPGDVWTLPAEPGSPA